MGARLIATTNNIVVSKNQPAPCHGHHAPSWRQA